MLAHQAIRNVARAPAMDEAVRKLEPVLDGMIARHRMGLRADAIAKVAFGLFTLYAVAAVLSRDRHGRLLALLTAAFGIVYELGELPLASRMVKETIAAAGPVVAELMAGGEAAARSQADQLAALQSQPAVFALIGVGWCLLLVRYFGGRRGRELYGLRRDPTRS
jgi:hypothetical protein